MLLNIKIHNAIDEDANKIISAVTKTLVDIRKTHNITPITDNPYMEYSFERETSTSTTYRGTENSTFANYINGTKKE